MYWEKVCQTTIRKHLLHYTLSLILAKQHSYLQDLQEWKAHLFLVGLVALEGLEGLNLHEHLGAPKNSKRKKPVNFSKKLHEDGIESLVITSD